MRALWSAHNEVRYHFRYGRVCPDYLCQRRGIENAEPICQQIPGLQVDEAVSNLLVDLLNPVTLEVALMVKRNSKQDWRRRIGCGSDKSNEPDMKPNSPKDDSCVLIPIIA